MRRRKALHPIYLETEESPKAQSCCTRCTGSRSTCFPVRHVRLSMGGSTLAGAKSTGHKVASVLPASLRFSVSFPPWRPPSFYTPPSEVRDLARGHSSFRFNVFQSSCEFVCVCVCLTAGQPCPFSSLNDLKESGIHSLNLCVSVELRVFLTC